MGYGVNANGDMVLGFDGSEIGDDTVPVFEIGYDGQLIEVGRKRRGQQRRDNRRGGGQQAIVKPAPQQMAITPVGQPMRHTLDPNTARRQTLGFNPAIVAGAGGGGFAEVNVQREFQAERLILVAVDNVTGLDASHAVMLVSFLIASVNQLASGAPQSLTAYRPDAIGAGVMLTPATVGTIIRLGFQNSGVNPVTVTGVFFGMTRGEG